MAFTDPVMSTRNQDRNSGFRHECPFVIRLRFVSRLPYREMIDGLGNSMEVSRATTEAGIRGTRHDQRVSSKITRRYLFRMKHSR